MFKKSASSEETFWEHIQYYTKVYSLTRPPPPLYFCPKKLKNMFLIKYLNKSVNPYTSDSLFNIIYNNIILVSIWHRECPQCSCNTIPVVYKCNNWMQIAFRSYNYYCQRTTSRHVKLFVVHYKLCT